MQRMSDMVPVFNMINSEGLYEQLDIKVSVGTIESLVMKGFKVNFETKSKNKSTLRLVYFFR